MRLISYNILDGGVGRADPIAEILQAQNADIITLIEADELSVVERIATRLKMDFVFAKGKSHSAAILSRFAIRESVNYAPLRPKLTNTFVLATIAESPRISWHVGAVHLHPHATHADEQTRVEELQDILELTRDLRAANTPHLLAGDFNANSPIQRIVKEKCKPRTQKEWDQNGGQLPRLAVQSVLDAGYRDTLHLCREEKAADMGTFSTQYPGQRVDYLFAYGLEPRQVVDAWIETNRLATYASDHYPIGVEVRLQVTVPNEASAGGQDQVAQANA
jgi:endonuclease/exonuclease/phosphatase family metal-dependent hydrolase